MAGAGEVGEKTAGGADRGGRGERPNECSLPANLCGLWILECARAERGAKFEIYRARFPPPNPEVSQSHERRSEMCRF